MQTNSRPLNGRSVYSMTTFARKQAVNTAKPGLEASLHIAGPPSLSVPCASTLTARLGVLGGSLAIAVGLLACDKAMTATPSLGEVTDELIEEHMLLRPTGDAEALLGRSVIPGPDGGWIVDDEPTPGCEVAVRRSSDDWERDVSQSSGKLAFLEVGQAQFGGLQLEYGKQLLIRAHVHNSETLTADLRGSCGDMVVKSVNVGTGSRSVFFNKELGGKIAGNGTNTAQARGRAGKWERTNDTLTWNKPQAWAFTVGTAGDETASIGLEVKMPTRIPDGGTYSLRIRAKRTAWLIVLYQEADGRAGLLLPTMRFPQHVVSANEELRMPAMEVSLRNPTAPANEKMVIYAFTNEADWERLKPPPGELSEVDAQNFADELEGRLRAIPRKRWLKSTVSYVITPKDD